MVTVQQLLLPFIKANLQMTLDSMGAPQEAIKAVDAITVATAQEATNIVNAYVLSVAYADMAEQYKKQREAQEKQETLFDPLKNLIS